LLNERLPKVKPDQTLELRKSLAANDLFYSKRFSEAELEIFCRYYQLVLKWNDRLPLTTITSPHGFAERHIFESAFAVQYLLPSIRQIFDLGSGLGIPGVPTAILRPDLHVVLVESNKKKAVFLSEMAGELGVSNIQVINCRFEVIREVDGRTCLTARAMEKMGRMIPQILMVGHTAAQFLFFGNNTLHDIVKMYLQSDRVLSSFFIPYSDNRLLISLTRST
jgi:16S rRNA (guanine(527)-N(7))-methyltransferase RsmG